MITTTTKQNMKTTIFLLVNTLLLHVKVSAWTQSQYFGNRLMTSVLRLREDDEVDVERTRLEKLFLDVSSDFHEDFTPLVNNMDQMVNLPVHNWMESPDDDIFSDWADPGPCFGDECEQCEIPAEFKKESVQDTLKFLGISRAEPLRVEKEL